MATITFTIDNDKLPKIISTMKRFFPIPQVPVDPEDPTKGTVPQFTDSQWAKEAVKRWVVSQVKRYEEVVAKEAINIQEDDNLIS